MRPAADNWECSDEKVHALIHLMTGMWLGGGWFWEGVSLKERDIFIDSVFRGIVGIIGKSKWTFSDPRIWNWRPKTSDGYWRGGLFEIQPSWAANGAVFNKAPNDCSCLVIQIKGGVFCAAQLFAAALLLPPPTPHPATYCFKPRGPQWRRPFHSFNDISVQAAPFIFSSLSISNHYGLIHWTLVQLQRCWGPL